MNERSWSTKRSWSLFAAAFALATAMFWATMITDPPKTEAALQGGNNPVQKAPIARADLLEFEDQYQRHIGVLDVLRP